MEPRFRNYLVLAAVLFIGLATAMAVYVGRPGTRDPNQPPDATQVVGVIVRVDSEGLTDVRGFGLRTDADADMQFSLERLQNGAEFAPGHLVEHQASSQPVVVWFESDGGINYALWLADAEQSG
jgi:hypothetical protein